jgi:hypothetical protein
MRYFYWVLIAVMAILILWVAGTWFVGCLREYFLWRGWIRRK